MTARDADYFGGEVLLLNFGNGLHPQTLIFSCYDAEVRKMLNEFLDEVSTFIY
mgnify:CR=1 FL=1